MVGFAFGAVRAVLLSQPLMPLWGFIMAGGCFRLVWRILA